MSRDKGGGSTIFLTVQSILMQNMVEKQYIERLKVELLSIKQKLKIELLNRYGKVFV